MGAPDGGRQQIGKHRHRSIAVRIGQAGAARRAGAEVVQPGGMALQAGLDLAQARSAGELRIEHCDQVALVAEATGMNPRRVLFDRGLKGVPRKQLQHRMEYDIVVRHGIDLLMSGDVAKRRTPSRINVVCFVQQKPCRTAVGQARP